MRIHTAAEVRAIDQHAASVLGLPTAWLMENAGRSVAEVVRQESGRRAKVIVVCGKGNNGGDGFVAARHLQAFGISVATLALVPADQMHGDAAANARAAAACGVPTESGLDGVGRGDVIVDALFGTGLTRSLEGTALELVRKMNAARERGARVIAVDVPSGINADLPTPTGECVRADVTVTLHCLKPALVQYPARELCGRVVVGAIGLPTLHTPGPKRVWLDAEQAKTLFPRRRTDAHKGTAGHVLVVAGSPGKSGAAFMSCAAALRSGAGLVTLASAPEVIDRVLPSLPEAMGHPMPLITGDALLDALQRKDALVIGPGIARTQHTGAVIVELLRHMPLPTIIDADGLNALAEAPQSLAELERAQMSPVLTPHPAELARLLGCSTAEVQADRFKSATEAARRFHAHIVLKGACSVIAHPDGSLEVNSTGNPAMATAGMGDVLSGVVGALLGQRVEAGTAAALSTFVHGRAGDLAAKGDRGLLATDVIAKLPNAMAELQ